jgi:hypothetical protein
LPLALEPSVELLPLVPDGLVEFPEPFVMLEAPFRSPAPVPGPVLSVLVFAVAPVVPLLALALPASADCATAASTINPAAPKATKN